MRKKIIIFTIFSFFNNYLFSAEKDNISEQINSIFEPIVKFMSFFILFDILPFLGIESNAKLPLVVVWLILGAVFFTIKMKFINIKGFMHAIDLVRGKYDNPKDKGEVSHFQALATALSATVGLGNIAGVAIAISIGGPGATFWMIVAGFLGMSSKFVEVTLGVKYRITNELGDIAGGPMYYLSKGLEKKNMAWLGKILAFVFAILIIGGSFGGGNMFQANQSFQILASKFPAISDYGFVFGIILAFLVGIVIIGGIKSIAKVTEKIVPFMAVFYVLTASVIIFMNISEVPKVFALIFDSAFSNDALKGGIIGVLVTGFKRAAFSNEAGTGSASIAHSAVKTEEPVSEGIVALLEPFIDTIVICTMTALVIIFTGFHNNPDGLEGVDLTSQAFASVFSWFPNLLIIAIFLFAFSSMISWSYYGLKAFNYLFAGKIIKNRKVTTNIYYVMFLFFVVVGSSASLEAVMDFSDMMVLAMAFPNILGLIFLSTEVKKDMKKYFSKIKSGEIKKFEK